MSRFPNIALIITRVLLVVKLLPWSMESAVRLIAFFLLGLSAGLYFPGAAHSANNADLNNDTVVNSLDIAVLMSHWGTAGGPSDIDDNGVVEANDLRHLLTMMPSPRKVDHLLRRITFGPTPKLQQEANTMGMQAYIEQQLNPASINDSELDAWIGNLVPVTDSRNNERKDLKSWSLIRMIYSKRQLLEVMTTFWDNHFSTNINDVIGSVTINNMQVALERAENEAFRANAFGNFRSLLEISAKSPTMLLYLNSVDNVKGDSNENYSRELLELHTMGVDGGYTHVDIEAGAEIFTGWQLDNDTLTFAFNPDDHNNSSETYLGVAIPAASPGTPGQAVRKGEQVLDILAAHPSTARFICTKLSILFVADNPPQSLLDRCATKFRNTVSAPDQIAQVLRVILTSPEFYDPEYYLDKIKNPVEVAAGIVRALEGTSQGLWLQNSIRFMGLDLYEKEEPTGWSETGDDWMNAGFLLERMKAADFMLRVNMQESMYTDLLSFFPMHGANSAEEIVDFILPVLLGREYPDLARQNALRILDGDGKFSLGLTGPNGADKRLRDMLIVVMSYPQYQFQ